MVIKVLIIHYYNNFLLYCILFGLAVNVVKSLKTSLINNNNLVNFELLYLNKRFTYF